MITLLVGENENECRSFIERHHVDVSRYRIVSMVDAVRGYIHGTTIVFLSKAHKRRDYEEILYMAKSCQLMVLQELR